MPQAVELLRGETSPSCIGDSLDLLKELAKPDKARPNLVHMGNGP